MKNSKKSEQRIQNQFGAFCTRVLKNETRYIQRELGNKAIKEKSYDELSEKDLYELAAYDNLQGSLTRYIRMYQSGEPVY